MSSKLLSCGGYAMQAVNTGSYTHWYQCVWNRDRDKDELEVHVLSYCMISFRGVSHHLRSPHDTYYNTKAKVTISQY